jgi:hypothetical protein
VWFAELGLDESWTSFLRSSAGALSDVDNGRMDKERKQRAFERMLAGRMPRLRRARARARPLALSVNSCLQDYEMWQEWSLHISRVSGGDLSS